MFSISPSTQNRSRKSESGVSIAIRNTMTSFHKEEELVEKIKPSEFIIKIANTLDEREAAFKLGYQIYLEKGYVKENVNQWLVNDYDVNQDTTILIVKDKANIVVGSVTLVFKNDDPIPAEKIYQEEINTLTSSGKKIAELSRLVISPDYRNSKEIILLLFNYLSIFAYYIKKYDCLTIQVNPRHKAYYEKLLNFKEIGGEKICPRVQNAPAVLMLLHLGDFHAKENRSNETVSLDKKDRTLYQYFLKPDQEKLVIYYLANQAKPMTNEEKKYFGFSESGINQLACV
jgi:hypothetical protein